MTAKKRTTKTGVVARPIGTEYRFRIDAYSPTTMPMARLAEYMAELAIVLGEVDSVHFLHLEAGSTVLVSQIEKEAIPKVVHRAKAIRGGEAPRDALIAYKTINRLLREDNAVGVLQERKRGPTLLEFPGRNETQEEFPSIKQHGTVEGFVMRVGGTDDTIPVLLESDGHQLAGCFTDKATAKLLALRLFEPARLYGHGSWARDAEGLWMLRSFRITSFEWLEQTSLSGALERVRALNVRWPEGAYDELARTRHGR